MSMRAYDTQLSPTVRMVNRSSTSYRLSQVLACPCPSLTPEHGRRHCERDEVEDVSRTVAISPASKATGTSWLNG